MKKSPNKYEGSDWKKFLKTQAYNISKKIGRALERYDDENISWVEIEKQKLKNEYGDENIWVEIEEQEPKTEYDDIKDILEEKSDLFVKRAIVWDIISYSRKLWWEKRLVTQFKCKYGLWITIDNLNSFISFCATHGFIPMIDKIYIEWQDISKIKDIYIFFAFAISGQWNPLIPNTLDNERKKLEEMVQWPAREVLMYLQQIVAYTASTYQYLLWERLQKIKNIWALSENIFAEIAIRLENQIREKIWIESSYLILAGYKDDTEKKTDMEFIIKKTRNQSYQIIPMQFTTCSTKGEKIKEAVIESYLIKRINWWMPQNNFIILSVNWEFSKHITHWDKENKLLLNKEYNDWINNPQEREKIVWSKFPLFIDTIKSEIIQPAEIMYVALHMLYKKYNFRYSMKESYLNSFKKDGKIDRTNRWDVNWIKLSDIFIEDCSVVEITNPRPNYPWILKHRFLISYHWEPMWVIVIYEVEQNTK